MEGKFRIQGHRTLPREVSCRRLTVTASLRVGFLSKGDEVIVVVVVAVAARARQSPHTMWLQKVKLRKWINGANGPCRPLRPIRPIIPFPVFYLLQPLGTQMLNGVQSVDFEVGMSVTHICAIARRALAEGE